MKALQLVVRRRTAAIHHLLADFVEKGRLKP
jgi:hypothetical protein